MVMCVKSMGLYWDNDNKRNFAFVYICTQECTVAIGNVNHRRKFGTPRLVVILSAVFWHSVVITAANKLRRL